MKAPLRTVIRTCTIFSCLGWAGMALGQEDLLAEESRVTSRHDQGQIEEIVVQARKRDELLEDTPVSVTALSESTLRQAGITRVDQIQELVPNMSFLQGFAGSQAAQIRLRGVGTSAPSPAFDPGVGFYVDGVFLSRAQGTLVNVVDVQQIEVLRGPQGTLFGKNTVGGAVNLTTIKPGPGLEGFVFLRPRNFGGLDTRVMLNVPVGAGWLRDRLFARAAFASSTSRGYVFNVYRDEEVSNEGALSFLGSVRFLPHEDVTLDVSGSWAKDADAARGGQCVFVQETPLTPLVPGYARACAETEPFVAGANLNQQNDVSNYGLWAVLEWQAGDGLGLTDVSLKSLTSWREQTVRFRTDLDGSPLDVVDSLQSGGGPRDGTPGDASQVQQELQLNASTWDGRLNFVTGFFSFWEDSFSGITLSAVPLGDAGTTNSAITSDNFTWALYAQGTADLTDWLSLTAGLRYTSDRKAIDQRNTTPLIPDSPTTGGSDARTFQSWTPMGSVALLAPDSWLGDTPIEHLMTYFTYSRGFKGGGFNAVPQPVPGAETPTPFGPETLDSFEIGLKTISFDQRITANVALFYGIYDDIQVTTQRTVTDDDGNLVVQRSTLNAAKATSKGVEVEVQARPAAGFLISGTLGYLDARYDRFPNALSDLTGGVIDRSGQTFNNAPEWQTFLSAQYSFPATVGGPSWLDGWVTPRVEWAYRDGFHVLGPEVLPTVQSGYHLINARLSYDFLDDRAQIALWGKNLTDRSYIDDGLSLTSAFGSVQRWFRPPRTFGAELSYHFGD